jgi:ATP-dependent Clp protease adapter protein ClpS
MSENSPVITVSIEQDVEKQLTRMHKVIMHNDDTTSAELVVVILMQIFSYSTTDAAQIMLDVHNHGAAMIGVYPENEAEEKSLQAMALARANGYREFLVTHEEY